MKTITKTRLNRYLKQDYPNYYERKHSVMGWLVRKLCQLRGIHPRDFLHDITQHGCSSGIISELIYTQDCVAFYATFESQIWDQIMEDMDTTGQTLGQFLDAFSIPITDESSLKVALSWFAVEKAAHRVMCHFLPY